MPDGKLSNQAIRRRRDCHAFRAAMPVQARCIPIIPIVQCRRGIELREKVFQSARLPLSQLPSFPLPWTGWIASA
jgi:hypothetical protein